MDDIKYGLHRVERESIKHIGVLTTGLSIFASLVTLGTALISPQYNTKEAIIFATSIFIGGHITVIVFGVIVGFIVRYLDTAGICAGINWDKEEPF